MPILRLVVTSLVLIAGLIGAALLMLVGFVIFVFNRLFGRATPTPRFQASFRRQAGRPSAPSQRGDVIDVVTTEVKDGESASAQPRLNG